MSEENQSGAMTFTPEETNAAANAEQFALQEAQMAHLQQRVVILRAALDRLAAENGHLREQLLKSAPKKPADRRRPAAKKPAPARASDTTQ